MDRSRSSICGARTVHAASPNLSIFGNVGFQGDFAGQLSNRFVTATPDIVLRSHRTRQPPGDRRRSEPSSALAAAVSIERPSGFSLRTSERGTVSVSAGAQRNFASGDFEATPITTAISGMSATIISSTSARRSDWQRSVQYQDYDNGLSSTVFNPLVTVGHQFSDQITASGSVGLLIAKQKFDAAAHRQLDRSFFSFSVVQRPANATAFAAGCRAMPAIRSASASGPSANSLRRNTVAGVNYSRQIDAKQSLQARLRPCIIRPEQDDRRRFPHHLSDISRRL